MNKLILLCAIIAGNLFSLHAQDVSQAEHISITELLAKNISYEVELFEQAVITGAIDAKVYLVVKEDNTADQQYLSEYIILYSNGKYEKLADFESITQFLKPDFALQNDKDANKFQQLVKLLSPQKERVSSFFKKDDTWCFVTNEFFEKKEGFAVKVDANGKVLEIKRDDFNKEK